MKQKKVKVWIAFLAGILFTGYFMFQAGVSAGAASSQPGSSGDPIITKSYLEKRLSELGTGGAVFSKVSVAKGKTATASAGTEIILYSGTGTVVGTAGLLNLSSGELFKNGNSLTLYSLYFSPASSSGIKASSDLTLFIKGNYFIK